ncbi:MAG TPA: hypothetical protein VGF38_13375 [Ktedonobacterales bacterium]|jgi:hypothetical protein
MAPLEMQTAKPGRWSERLRMLGVAVLSGLAVGLGAALGARLIMRIIAVALGQATMFTAATFVLLRTGLYDGILMGLFFVAIRRYLPGSALVKGIVFGILLLALAALPFVLPFVNELPAAPVLGSGLFATLFLATGIAEAAAVAYLERRLPAPRRRLASLLGYGLLLVLAAYAVFSFVFESVALLLGNLLPHMGALVGDGISVS